MPSMPSLPLQRKSTFSLLKSSCVPKSRDFSTPAAFRINSAGFRQNYCKKAAPQEKSCEAIFRRKRNSGNRFCRRLKSGESRAAKQFDGGFLASSNMQNPDGTCSDAPDILAFCLLFPGGRGAPPREKQAVCLFSGKMEGRESSLPIQGCSTVQNCIAPFEDQIT